ncbi:SDR family NAD(P)-dependent oxidoreductase [Nonomuraea sp. NPDC051191]|uniref:SDR family NAD(P)-dependent oxidoreductase n=1 Tax=Nonomuraea sp. NPDC051191 TaxID=3364372 RepID=UPI0037A0D750
MACNRQGRVAAAGSVAVHAPLADAVFVGDALTTRHVLTGREGPQPALRSTLLGTRHALPHLIKGGGGSVVNTASVAGLVGDVLQIAYGAVKAAVINITKSIAVQYGPQRVRCNAVAPGAVVTPALLGNLPEEVVESLERVNALPYLGDPEDIGHTMVFLASDESRYMTGQLLVVDGGMTIRSPAAQGRQDMLPPSS